MGGQSSISQQTPNRLCSRFLNGLSEEQGNWGPYLPIPVPHWLRIPLGIHSLAFRACPVMWPSNQEARKGLGPRDQETIRVPGNCASDFGSGQGCMQGGQPQWHLLWHSNAFEGKTLGGHQGSCTVSCVAQREELWLQNPSIEFESCLCHLRAGPLDELTSLNLTFFFHL